APLRRFLAPDLRPRGGGATQRARAGVPRLGGDRAEGSPSAAHQAALIRSSPRHLKSATQRGYCPASCSSRPSICWSAWRPDLSHFSAGSLHEVLQVTWLKGRRRRVTKITRTVRPPPREQA